MRCKIPEIDGSKTGQIMAARNLQKESTIWPCFCGGGSASSSSDKARTSGTRFWPVIHGVLTPGGVAKYVCLAPAEQLGKAA